jgi:two-component system, sensor histidine kinase and response regulator
MSSDNLQTTILVVDDNALNANILKALLARFNYEIIITLNGPDALKILESTAVDLILLDIMMPEMDGFEVCDRIKANDNTKEIPVIFLTAKTETDDIIMAFDKGGADYLTKPFRKEELIARINTHLEIFFARKKIIKQNQQLEKVIWLRDKIYSVIAHDLRAPLSNLKMLSNVINANIDKVEDEDLVEVIKMMERTIDESFDFLDNLLKWTRQQSGRVVVNKVEFTTNDLVLECISLNQLKADQKNIELLFDKDKYIGDANGDMDIFKTVLRNLISNAIKFSWENSRIVISQSLVDDKIIVSVKDSGTGIEPEDQKKLLNEREHYTTYGTRQEKGAGLGLQLSYDLSKQNGGSLWFESTPGQGSTFYFSVPAKCQN